MARGVFVAVLSCTVLSSVEPAYAECYTILPPAAERAGYWQYRTVHGKRKARARAHVVALGSAGAAEHRLPAGRAAPLMMDQSGAAIDRRDWRRRLTPRTRGFAVMLRRGGARGRGGRAPLPLAIDPTADVDGIIEAGIIEAHGRSQGCGESSTGLSATGACTLPTVSSI
jgi:hypothetical protein